MKKKLPLIWKLIMAITTGIVVGFILNLIANEGNYWAQIPIRLLATFNGLFGNFLGFVVPLLILAFVAVGIGGLEHGAGRMLGFSVLLAYLSTLFAAIMAYVVASISLSNLLRRGSVDVSSLYNAEEFLLSGYFNVEMPVVFSVISALLLAFILGLGISSARGKGLLYEGLESFQGIIEKVIANVIIPLLPLHIAGIFANMAFSGKAAQVMSTLIIVFILVLVLHWIVLLILFFIAGSINKRNPFKLLKNMLVAYVAALGTQSSVATMPVTRKQTLENGVSEEVTNFVIPLFATIHMPGSVITITTCAIAVSTLMGHTLDVSSMIGFVFMLGIMIVAAPGVPGGAIMASLGVLESFLGFDPIMLSIMIALYLAQDSFGTATNVTGGGALAVVVDNLYNKKSNKLATSVKE